MIEPMTGKRLEELESRQYHNHTGEADRECFACVLRECTKEIRKARELLESLEPTLRNRDCGPGADKIRAFLDGEEKEGTCGALYEAGYTSKEAANSRDRSQWVERRCTRVAGHKGSCES